MKKKCVRMGITELKTVIWEGKSVVLKLNFKVPLTLCHKKICEQETDDLPHKMTILSTFIH